VWRAEPGEIFAAEPHEGGIARGAEAVVEIREADVVKRRESKRYRNPRLDRRLITERTRAEARLIAAARRAGVPTPVIRDITTDTIVMERVAGEVLKYATTPENVALAGDAVGKLHAAGIVHGDLTTSNMIIRDDQCVLIDFGLASTSPEVEARGVDLHVLFQTLESTTENSADLKAAFIEGYAGAFPGAGEVLSREHEVELRGRYL
ncbi:MAG: Kae1-associated kinase Bud32, partial [Methanoculleus sp.]